MKKILAILLAGMMTATARSEERRVGKEGRYRWSPYHLKKKKKSKDGNGVY